MAMPSKVTVEQVQAATAALGISEPGVTRIDIGVREVRVERFAIDEDGDKMLLGKNVIRFIDTITVDR